MDASQLAHHDAEKRIYQCLWESFSGPVRALINNQYVFAPFWEAQRLLGAGEEDTTAWQERFEKTTKVAMTFLAQQKVAELLGVVLDRLYVLRNQIMHGGATWQSKVNRQQVKDGCNMLSALMPVIVEIMLDARDENWGEIFYPVVS